MEKNRISKCFPLLNCVSSYIGWSMAILEGSSKSNDQGIFTNYQYFGTEPYRVEIPGGGGGKGEGGTLGISGWGCAAVTLELLAYTRASSTEFCYRFPSK